MQAHDFAGALQDAEDLYRAGRHHEAFAAYEALLRARLARQQAGEAPLTSVAELVVVERLAQLAQLVGCTAATDLLLDAAAALCRAAGNGYAAAYYTLQRAASALEHGRLHDCGDRLHELAAHIGDFEVIDVSEAGLVLWEAACRWPGLDAAARAVLFSRLYLVIGGLLAALGQYAQALRCLARGTAHTTPAAPELARRVLPHLRLAEAGARLEAGELARARAILDECSSAPADAADPAIEAARLGLAGKAASLEGRGARALELLERLVGTVRAAGLGRAQAIAELNLAQLRIVLNQTAAAHELVEAAAEKAERLGDRAIALRAQGLSLLIEARGRSLAESVTIAPAVAQMWQTTPTPSPGSATPTPAAEWPEMAPTRSFLELFEDRALRLQWWLGQGDVVAAARTLEEMQAPFGGTDSELIAARMQALGAMLAYYAGPTDTTAAWDHIEALLADAGARLCRLGLRPELWQMLRLRVWAGRRAGRSREQLLPWSEEADALLAEMSGSLDDSARAIYLLNKWTADEEALAAEVDSLMQLRREHALAPWWRRLAPAWRIKQAVASLLWRIDRYKASAGWRAIGSGAAQPAQPRLGATAAWHRWPSGQATVATLVLPDRTVILAVCGWRSWFGVSSVTRLAWREAVQSWHQALHEAVRGSEGPVRGSELEERLNSRAELLGRLLQLPELMTQLPRGVRRLRFVPDDVLHALPFAALRVDGRPLVASHAISLDFSARPSRPAPAARNRHALLVGIGRALGPYGALPGAVREVAQLQRLLARQGWSPSPLIDEGGTPEAVRAGLPRSGLVHIACHGVFDASRPGESGLLLPGPRATAQTLTLREVAQLDLSSVRHAGLSACWTADHVVLPGRWAIGLPEALRRAGAHSVAAWLWPAPDRYAAAVTTRFYDLLSTCRRDEALQRVYAEARTGTAAALLPAALRSLPMWAGLQLYGEAGTLRV